MKILITERQLNYLVQNLFEDFKSQKIKYIEQGNDEFIVDTYLKDFREIKDKKFKELENADLEGLDVPKGASRYDIDRYKTFKEVELVVDYMAGQRKFGSANFEDIKVDGEPIYNDENVEIYYAPNRESCIQYKGNKPYSWCIARGDASNMFMRYRVGYDKPSFYFVKRKDATDREFEYWNTSGDKFSGQFRDKWHFFVIQVLKDKKYEVTSAMNDGDVTMTWDEILNKAPELQGKENYFEPKPLSDTEIEKYEKYQKKLSDDEFKQLSYNEKELYIDYYVGGIEKRLTDNQFSYLPDDLKNKYINLGINLSNNQFNLIKNNKKLVNRFEEVFNEIVKDKLKRKELNPLMYISESKYDLLNDENKMLFDKIMGNELKQELKQLTKSLDRWGSPNIFDEISMFLKVKHDPRAGWEVQGPSYPNIVLLKKYVDKSEIKQNESLVKHLFFYSLSKSKETMLDFMNYLGVDYKKIISSFDRKENEFFEKITKFLNLDL